jgi:glutamate carboxypeptidase
MPTPAVRFQTALKKKLPQMLALTERLVNIESCSYFKAGVDEVNAVVQEELTRSGFDVERTPMTLCGDQLVAVKRMRGQGRLLVLGHSDTVWAQGAARDWRFTAQDNRASGPGIGDMKAGLAMAIFALRELLASGFEGLELIRFLMVPDEELGSIHSRSRIEACAREADWALVLQPGRPGGGVVTSRGAVGAYFMHAQGLWAHCATSYRKGASAVRELSLKVSLLDSLSNPDDGIIVNVGLLRGGSARQVVPGDARMDIDVRARTIQQAENLVAKIHDIATETRDERVKVQLSGRITRPPFPATHNRDLFKTAVETGAELGITITELETQSGGSDGNFTAAINVPTLDGLGPICTDVCSREEAIEIPSLADRGALLAGIIERLGSNGAVRQRTS